MLQVTKIDEVMNVVHFQRKPRSTGNFSAEFIANDLRERLGGLVRFRVAVSSFKSNGIFRRLYNCLEAWWRQGEVNHVTGDVNYLGLFLRPSRCIQTILDCVHLDSCSGLRYSVLRWFWLAIPTRRCRLIIAISEATKAQILRHVQCDPKKIVVIPVAISAGFSPCAKPFNRVFPRLLQIGTAPNKNVFRLLDAVRGLDCVLDIVGGPDPALTRALEASGIRYEFRTGLSASEIIEAYQLADVVTFVSTYEGFGMPILEAQATGRVVVTSNVHSMPEVAGDAACLVDPFSVASIRAGIRRVIEDDGFRSGLIARGFDNVKRFDPNSIALRYLEVYREVASTAPLLPNR